MNLNDLSYRIIGACIEVHKVLGPGLLESSYEECLARELEIQGIKYKKQVPLPIKYKGLKLDAGYRLDFLVKEVIPIHTAQLLTYLKISEKN